MMQLLLPRSETSEIELDVQDLENMRKAFAGIHIDPRRRTFQRIHLESGQAFLTDGLRLHTVPVKYPSHIGVDLDLEVVRQGWDKGMSMRLAPQFSDDTFLQWQ